MSPARKKTSGQVHSPESPSMQKSDVKTRKRVRKACDRCRIKKTKCDGSSPCLRCRTDDVLCCAKESHRFRRRNFPQGYAEMLERQQGQLVSCIQTLYQRLRSAGLWEQSLPEKSDGQPLTHDILAALNLLQQKDDGRSVEFERFVDVVPSSQSDDSTPSLPDGDTAVHDRHDSITDHQSKSPTLSIEDTVHSRPSTDLDSYSVASIGARPPLEPHLNPSPEPFKQTQSQTRMPYSLATQSRAECASTQAQLFATLAATPIHRSVYDTPDLHFRRSMIRPSLSLDPQLTRRDSRPNQAMSAPLVQFPFSHEWAKTGITLDNSDFATDFHQLSPLDASRADVGSSSLVPGAL